MSTSTLGALIASTLVDVKDLGTIAITGIFSIAVALMILGFFWSRLTKRATKSKGF